VQAVPKDAKVKEAERWKTVAACVPGKVGFPGGLMNPRVEAW